MEDTSCLPSKSKLYTLGLKDMTRSFYKLNEENGKGIKQQNGKGRSLQLATVIIKVRYHGC